MIPPTSVTSTTLVANTAPLFRRANLRNRYHAEGGQANTGSSFK
jgi:hypothetical protein